MSEFKLTTVEEFEEATARLLETGAKVGADAWQFRVKNQTPHCKFGEQGVCCRICSMGPCRITPKAPRGVCGCDAHGIVGRNFLKFTAGGAATHSDHGREICHTLYCAKDGGNYQVKDPEKLIRIAKEWGVETEGKDIYDLAHEMAETGLMEYGKPFGYQRFLDRMPAGQKEKLIENEIAPRAIDREVSTSLHMAHMGCSSLPEALVKQSIRCGLADGWGGSMMGTEFSDVLFGTPKPIDTEANLGVMVEENVNLGIKFYDRDLVDEIIKEVGIPTDIMDRVEEGGTIAGKGAQGDVRGSFSKYADLTDRAIHVQKQIIRKLAQKEACVIIGRSADYILKDTEGIQLVRAFIYAPNDVRVHNIMESHNLSEKDAKLLLDEKDKRYHKRHLALTGSNRGDRHNRDILINSDFLGIQGTAEYLEDLIAKKYGKKEA